MPISPFDPARVSADTARFNEALARTLAELPPVHTVPVEVTRRARAEGRGVFRPAGPLPGSEWQAIEGAAGRAARVRISRPRGQPRGSYLHVHGGGWTLGAPDQFDLYNQRIAARTGLEVVSVEYRLAPEAPWPAAAEDCLAAALWLLADRDGPVAVGGESAGAHLAAVTALRLRQRGLAGRVRALVLNYGMFDLRLTPSARRWGERVLILSTPIITWFRDNLIRGADPADPALSPLLADLGGLPPALLQVGTEDPLLDDTLFMAARWQAAGNRAETAIWPGGIHAFDCFELPLADEAHRRLDDFLCAAFAAEGR